MTRLPPENTVETCHECGSEVEVGFHCGFVTKCPHCNSRLVACNKCFDLQQEQGIDQICDWNKETNLCFRLRGESPLKIQALKEIIESDSRTTVKNIDIAFFIKISLIFGLIAKGLLCDYRVWFDLKSMWLCKRE